MQVPRASRAPGVKLCAIRKKRPQARKCRWSQPAWWLPTERVKPSAEVLPLQQLSWCFHSTLLETTSPCRAIDHPARPGCGSRPFARLGDSIRFSWSPRLQPGSCHEPMETGWRSQVVGGTAGARRGRASPWSQPEGGMKNISGISLSHTVEGAKRPAT